MKYLVKFFVVTFFMLICTYSLAEQKLVSIDFKGIKQSCVIDIRWLKVSQNKVKLVLWYDNEWGYANRIIDLIKLLDNS